MLELPGGSGSKVKFVGAARGNGSKIESVHSVKNNDMRNLLRRYKGGGYKGNRIRSGRLQEIE